MYGEIQRFKNIYLNRKEEIGTIKEYLPRCENQIKRTKECVKTLYHNPIVSPECLDQANEECRKTNENYYKLLEYIKEKEEQLTMFEPFV